MKQSKKQQYKYFDYNIKIHFSNQKNFLGKVIFNKFKVEETKVESTVYYFMFLAKPNPIQKFIDLSEAGSFSDRSPSSINKSQFISSFYHPSKQFGALTARTESTDISERSVSKCHSTRDYIADLNLKPVKFIKIVDKIPNLKQLTKKITSSPNTFRSYFSNDSNQIILNSQDSVKNSLSSSKIRSPLFYRIDPKKRKQIKKDQAFIDFMKHNITTQQIKTSPHFQQNYVDETNRENGQISNEEIIEQTNHSLLKHENNSQNQLSRSLFLKQNYQLQKQALQKYLQGEPVDKKIIDSHQNLLSPLKFNIHKKNQKLKQNKINNQKEKKTINSENEMKFMLKSPKQLSEKIDCKQQNQFYKLIQKDNEQYFQTLENLKQQTTNDFHEISNLRHKYQSEWLFEPTDVFVNKNSDLKISQQQSKLLDLIKGINSIRQTYNSSVQSNISNFLNSKLKKKQPNSQSSFQNDSIISKKEQQSLIPSNEIKKKNKVQFTFMVKQAIFKSEQNNTSSKDLKENVQDQTSSSFNNVLISQDIQVKQSFVDTILNSFILEKEREFRQTRIEILFQKQFNQIFQNYQDVNNLLQEINQLIKNTGNQLNEQERSIFNMIKQNQIDDEFKIKVQENPYIIFRQDETGKSLLHWAAIRGYPELTTLLIGMKANINLQDVRFQTPKKLAQLYKHFQVFGILSQEESYQKSLKIADANQKSNLLKSRTLKL